MTTTTSTLTGLTGRPVFGNGGWAGGSFSPGGGLQRIAWNSFLAPYVQNMGFVPGVLTYTTIDVVRPDAVSLGEAYVTWGKSSRFLANDQSPTQPIYDSFNTQDPDKPPTKPKAPGKPPQKDDKVQQWQEVGREEEEVKVFNTQDHSQYVIVARVTSMKFNGPDGSKHQFNFKPPQE